MRKEKQLLLNEVKEKVEKAPSFVITSYRGLNPNLGFDIRKVLCDAGSEFTVVKKRLFLKVAEEIGVQIDHRLLEGHIAIVSSGEDTVGMAKALYGFAKDHQEVFNVLGGYFDGKVCSATEVEQISKLPTKEEMQAMFLSTLEAPLSQTLGVFDAVLTSVIHCLNAKMDKENQ